MTTRRNKRIRATGVDEVLERFLKFRPTEFYGEVEQEIKAKLFLKQLSDIYDTLKYEDALRVTFATFRLRGMVKDWWVRASEARALKNQPSIWNDFQEEFRKEYVFQVELQRALAPLPPMRFTAAFEATTMTKMADQAVTQRNAAIGSAAIPYKRPGQAP
ncbi:hypothetical protein M9H77_23310 [Catharanthus roseus]|uniref:Uncharacterized protein n=1 Tax=Catharanthus roseus TaxID=4058 RepID=A0ACC0ASK0_CATRO|nr:hypothetical protein M9H77_23310 [Catharanthus roseus]